MSSSTPSWVRGVVTRKALGWVFRISVGAILVFLVARGRTAEIAEAFRMGNPGWLAAGVLALVVVFIISAARWQYYLGTSGVGEFHPMRVLRLTFSGAFFNAFLPTGVGGDAYKAVRISSRGDRAGATASVFLDRFSGLVGLALVSFTAMASDLDSIPKKVLFAAASVSVAVIVMTAIPRASREWVLKRAHIEDRGPIGESAWRAVRAVASANRSIGSTLGGYVWGAASQLGVLLMHGLVAAAVNIEVGLGTLAAAAVLAQVVTLIPITVNGLGLREATYVWVFGSAGVAEDVAVAFAVGMLAILVVGSLIGGLVYVAGPHDHDVSDALDETPTLPA